MPDRGEKHGYKIKPEERQLMIEAGVQFYLNRRNELGEDWDPEVFYKDKRFQALPYEVKKAIWEKVEQERKAEANRLIAEKKPADEETAWRRDRLQELEEIKQTKARPKGLAERARDIGEHLRQAGEYAMAISAYREAFRRGSRSPAIVYRIANMFVATHGTEAAKKQILKELKDKRWIDMVEKTIDRARGKLPIGRPWIEPEARAVLPKEVPPGAKEAVPVSIYEQEPEVLEELTVSTAEEGAEEEGEQFPQDEPGLKALLVEAGIDPGRPLSEYVDELVVKQEQYFDDLKKQIAKFDFEQCEKYLTGGLEEAVEAALPEISMARLRGLRRLLYGSAQAGQEVPWQGFWFKYLNTLIPALEGIYDEQTQNTEIVRLDLQDRAAKLLKGDKRLRRKVEEERARLNKGRDVVAAGAEQVLDEGALIREVNEAMGKPGQGKRQYEIDVEDFPKVEQLAALFDKKLQEADSRIKEAMQRVPEMTLEQCENFLEHDGQDAVGETRAWFGSINRIKLAELLMEVERLGPSADLPVETLQYWRNYIHTILDKLHGVDNAFDDQLNQLHQLVQERRATLHREKEEQLWRAEGLPAAIRYEMEDIKEKIAADKKDGKIREDANESDIAYRRALGNAEFELVLRLSRSAKEVAFDRSNLEQELERFLEKWQAVFEELNAKTGDPISVEEIVEAEAKVYKERTDPATAAEFRYKSGRLNWGKLFRTVGSGEVPDTKKIIELLRLDPDSFEAETVLLFLDRVEARRRIPEMRRAKDETVAAGRRQEAEERRFAERTARVAAREAERQAEREAWETEFGKELPRWLLQKRAEFFGLVQAWQTGNQEAVRKFFASESGEERRDLGRDLFIRALEERGMAVPGSEFRDLVKGRTTIRDWDHFVIDSGGKNPKHVYGYLKDLRVGSTPADYVWVVQEYDPYTQELGEVVEIPNSRVLKHDTPEAASLDGRVSVQLAQLAGARMFDRIDAATPERGNVTHIRPGTMVQGMVNVNTGGREKVVFDDGFLVRPGGRWRRGGGEKPNSAEALFFDNYLSSRTAEEFERMAKKLSPEQLTMFVDHHASISEKDSSGTKYLYALLRAMGALDHLNAAKRKALQRAIQFVGYEDNKAHPEWHKGDRWNWNKHSSRTMLGLARHTDLRTLMRFYEKYADDPDADIRELTDAELKEFGLEQAFKEQTRIVQDSEVMLQGLEGNGYVLENTRYGTLVLLTPHVEERYQAKKQVGWKARLPTVPGGIDAVRARYGPQSAMLIWNPFSENGRLFMSTSGEPLQDLPAEIKAKLGGQFEILRGTMMHGFNVAGGSLRDLLPALAKEGEVLQPKVDSLAYKFLEKGKNGSEDWQREKLRIQRIEDPEYLNEKLPQLNAPVPLGVDERGEVYVPEEYLGAGRRVVVNLPEGISAEYISQRPHLRHHVRLRSFTIDTRYGQKTKFYTADYVEEEPLWQETYELEQELQRLTIEELRKQGLSLKLEKSNDPDNPDDIGVLMSETARAMGKGAWQRLIERLAESESIEAAQGAA